MQTELQNAIISLHFLIRVRNNMIIIGEGNMLSMTGILWWYLPNGDEFNLTMEIAASTCISEKITQYTEI